MTHARLLGAAIGFLLLVVIGSAALGITSRQDITANTKRIRALATRADDRSIDNTKLIAINARLIRVNRANGVKIRSLAFRGDNLARDLKRFLQGRGPGVEGAPGKNGVIGAQGTPGGVGAVGPPGGSGLRGVPGEDGTSGINGEAGAKGEPGATGPQGPPGIQGDPGPQGPPGATGPAGPAGPPAP